MTYRMSSLMFAALLCGIPAAARAQAAQQPLNASVSGFGTSFIFSPAPVCKGCLQTELGVAGIGDDRFVSAILTFAPADRLDLSVLLNPYERTGGDGRFGQRFDVVVRRQVFANDRVIVSLAPRGAFTRDGSAGLGGTVAGQYARSGNVVAVNLTGIGGLSASGAIPRDDLQVSADYSRSVGSRGANVFVGFQLRGATDVPLTRGYEAGLTLPFRNGQVETAVERYVSSAGHTWQLQARVLVNWQKVF